MLLDSAHSVSYLGPVVCADAWLYSIVTFRRECGEKTIRNNWGESNMWSDGWPLIVRVSNFGKAEYATVPTYVQRMQ